MRLPSRLGNPIQQNWQLFSLGQVVTKIEPLINIHSSLKVTLSIALGSHKDGQASDGI
jgi:hypothetical protein